MIKDPAATNGWIIRNLREYHNSLIPDSVIELVNGRQDLVPVLIKYASGIDVKINTEGDLLTAWE